MNDEFGLDESNVLQMLYKIQTKFMVNARDIYAHCIEKWPVADNVVKTGYVWIQRYSRQSCSIVTV